MSEIWSPPYSEENIEPEEKKVCWCKAPHLSLLHPIMVVARALYSTIIECKRLWALRCSKEDIWMREKRVERCRVTACDRMDEEDGIDEEDDMVLESTIGDLNSWERYSELINI